jgi:hypothetical protein
MGGMPTTSVPRLWPGETVVILGCGPSLKAEAVNAVKGRARVIAINQSYQFAPWADLLYACDASWWQRHHGVPSFTALKYGLETGAKRWPGVQTLQHTGKTGLELLPTSVKHGQNSGYQAINLAVHLGASRILLLGYDMRDPGRPQERKYLQWIENFATIVEPLRQIGVEVVNCTPSSALKCFPYQSIADALAVQAVAS